MSTLIRHQVIILCTAATVFLIGLGAPKLWDEDEPEYARCTQEMMHRGDMIVPTFNDHLWTDKPVFLYWLIMGSFTLFGQTEFAARLPCALLAIGHRADDVSLGSATVSSAGWFMGGTDYCHDRIVRRGRPCFVS